MQAVNVSSSMGWRPWVLAARPATLPAAIVPVIVGTAAAASIYDVQWLPFAAALLASLLIQVGTNLANDVFDFRRGADTKERLGPIRITAAGMAPPALVFRATLLTFGAAVLVGIYLVSVGGLPILLVGVACIAAGMAYTGGPWPLGYHGLGDAFVFVFFGPVGVIGSAYLQHRAVLPLAMWASIPVGLLVTAILVVNNLRDVDQDRTVGKITLAVRLGRQATRVQYVLCICLSYLVPIVLWRMDLLNGWFWLPLLTLPLAVRVIRTVRHETGRVLNVALKDTGRLHLFFGGLFAATIWLAH